VTRRGLMLEKVPGHHYRRRLGFINFASVVICLSIHMQTWAAPAPLLRFEISFPEAISSRPVTGRVFVVISKENSPEPRMQAGFWGDSAPLFGRDVNQLRPGQSAVIDDRTLGYLL